MEIKKTLNTVIGELQRLDIRSSYENMNSLLGSIQILMQIRDALPENIDQAMLELGQLRTENEQLKRHAQPAEDPENAGGAGNPILPLTGSTEGESGKEGGDADGHDAGAE